MFLAALQNFELSDWSMDGCGEEQIGIPDFGELAPVLRRVGEFLAENKLGERVSVEVAADCLVQLDSPPQLYTRRGHRYYAAAFTANLNSSTRARYAAKSTLRRGSSEIFWGHELGRGALLR